MQQKEENDNNDLLNVRMRTGSELNLLLEDFNKNCFFQQKPKKDMGEVRGILYITSSGNNSELAIRKTCQVYE